jgi:hypothetical protein
VVLLLPGPRRVVAVAVIGIVDDAADEGQCAGLTVREAFGGDSGDGLDTTR